MAVEEIENSSYEELLADKLDSLLESNPIKKTLNKIPICTDFKEKQVEITESK